MLERGRAFLGTPKAATRAKEISLELNIAATARFIVHGDGEYLTWLHYHRQFEETYKRLAESKLLTTVCKTAIDGTSSCYYLADPRLLTNQDHLWRAMDIFGVALSHTVFPDRRACKRTRDRTWHLQTQTIVLAKGKDMAEVQFFKPYCEDATTAQQPIDYAACGFPDVAFLLQDDKLEKFFGPIKAHLDKPQRRELERLQIDAQPLCQVIQKERHRMSHGSYILNAVSSKIDDVRGTIHNMVKLLECLLRASQFLPQGAPPAPPTVAHCLRLLRLMTEEGWHSSLKRCKRLADYANPMLGRSLGRHVPVLDVGRCYAHVKPLVDEVSGAACGDDADGIRVGMLLDFLDATARR